MFNRSPQGQFNPDLSFVSVDAGTNGYILEDEFNEMQWIQIQARASLFRKIAHSGFLTDGPFQFPVLSNIMENRGTFGVYSGSELRVNVHGYELRVGGNDVPNRVAATPVVDDLWLLLQVPTPPSTGTRTDIVILEAWFEQVSGYSNLHLYGGQTDVEVVNPIIDPRMDGVQTTQRVQLQWRVRTIAGVDNITDVYANNTANDSLAQAYPYLPSPEEGGSYIAGNSGAVADIGSIDGFMYAIPLATVTRLNTTAYDANLNPNGAWGYHISTVSADLIVGTTVIPCLEQVNFIPGQPVSIAGNTYMVVDTPSLTSFAVNTGLLTSVTAGTEVVSSTPGNPTAMYNNVIYPSQVTDLRLFTRPSSVTPVPNSTVVRDPLGGLQASYLQLPNGSMLVPSGTGGLNLDVNDLTSTLGINYANNPLFLFEATSNGGTLTTASGTLTLSSVLDTVQVSGTMLNLSNGIEATSLALINSPALSYLPTFNPNLLYVNATPFGNTLVPAASGTYVVGPLTLAGNLDVIEDTMFEGDVTIAGNLNVENILGVTGLVTTAEVGSVNGVAPLDGNAFVPSANLGVNGLVDGPNLAGIAHFESNVFTTRGDEGSFTRESIAYNPDTMTEVGVNVPRFVNSRIGKGVLLEQGTTQLLLNTDIETFNNVATLFQDQLQFNTAWTLQGGSVTWGNTGATFTSYGWVGTNANLPWSPQVGTNGATLRLSTTAAYYLPTLTARLDLYLAVDATHYYQLEANYQNSEQLALVRYDAGTVTVLASGSWTPVADSNYTLLLNLDPSGNLQGEIYSGLTANGTPILNIAAVDTTWQANLTVGVGGDTGVIVSQVMVSAPAPSVWGFANLGNENYVDIATFALSGQHSLHFRGTAAGSFDQRYTGLTPGAMYTVSVYVYVLQGQLIMQVSNDSNSPALGGYTGAAAKPTWQRISQTFTADPTGIADVTFSGNLFPCEFYLDAIQLEPRPYATSYLRNDSVSVGSTVSRVADLLSFPGPLLDPIHGSISFWLNPYVDWQDGITPQYQEWVWLVGTGDVGTNDAFFLGWNQNYLKYGIGTSNLTIYNYLPPADVWTHLALTWDTELNQSILYLNSVPVASGSASAFTNTTVNIGSDTHNRYLLNGVIDELAFFHRVITPLEITRLYHTDQPLVDAYQSDAVTLQGTGLDQFVLFNTDNNQPFYSVGTGALVADWYAIDSQGGITPPMSNAQDSYGTLLLRELVGDLNLLNYAPNGQALNYYGRIYGYITAPTTDTYTFYLTTDDGGRLYVNGTELVNNWIFESPTQVSGSIALESGSTYPILMEYFQRSGTSQLALDWSTSTFSQQQVPSGTLSWSTPWYGGFEVVDNLILHNELLVQGPAMFVQTVDVTGVATLNGGLDVTGNTVLSGNLQVDDELTVLGTGTHLMAGQLELNGTTPMVILQNNGTTGPPGNNGETFKINTWNDGSWTYGIGIDSVTQWYSADQIHAWYDHTRIVQMELNGANLTVVGTVTSNTGTSSFVDLSTTGLSVTTYAQDTLLIGSASNIASGTFAVAIAVPSGAGVWPLGISTPGNNLFSIDTVGNVYPSSNNGLKLLSPSGTHTMTVDNYGNVVVYGNLTIQGTQTTIDSTTTNIATQWLELNTGETGTPTQPAGIEVYRGTSQYMTLEWDEAAKHWAATDVNNNLWPIVLDNGNIQFNNAINAQTLTLTGNELMAGNLGVSGTITGLGALTVGNVNGSYATTQTQNYIYGSLFIGDSADNYLRIITNSSDVYLENVGNNTTYISGANNTNAQLLQLNFNQANVNGIMDITGNLQVGSVGTNSTTYLQDLHVQAGDIATATTNYGSRWIYLDGSTWNGTTAVTTGFIVNADSPTELIVQTNDNGTFSTILTVQASGTLALGGQYLSLANGANYLTNSVNGSNNALFAYNNAGMLLVGTQDNWDYSGGLKVNTTLDTLDIGTADTLGFANVSNTLTGGVRILNNLEVNGTLTIQATNNNTTINTNGLWIGQGISAGAYLQLANANSTNYIESFNNTQNGNADLWLTGYSANQGSNLYLDFATLYSQGNLYLDDTVVRDGSQLYFGTNTSQASGTADNNTPIYLTRSNDATNSSGLHLVIGATPGQQPDYLVASGTGDYLSVETTPDSGSAVLLRVTSAGDSYVAHNLSVAGTLFVGDHTTELGSHAALNTTTVSGTTTLGVNPNGNYNNVLIASPLNVTGNLITLGSDNNTSNWVNIVAASGSGNYGYKLNGAGILGIFPAWSTDTLYLNVAATSEGQGPNYAGGVQAAGHLGVLGGDITAVGIGVPSNTAATEGTTGVVGSYLAASTTYYYGVTATTTDGETPISNIVAVNTGATIYPITVTWTESQGASGYRIYRGLTSTTLDYVTEVGITGTWIDNGTIAPNTGIQPPTLNTTGGQLNLNNLAFGVVTSYGNASGRVESSGYIDLKPGSNAANSGLIVRSQASEDYTTLSANDAYANLGFLGYQQNIKGLTFDDLGNTHVVGGELTVDAGIYVNAGSIHLKGEYVEVHRRPLFGWASSAGAYNTNSANWNGPDIILYAPFATGTYGLPSTTGTRYYRLYALWSDNIGVNSSEQLYPYLQLYDPTTSSAVYEWQMDYTNGDPTLGSRDGYSPYFQATSTDNLTLQVMINDAAQNLGGTAPQSGSFTIFAVYLIAYDVW